jgi:ATP-binding cassette, subfamily C (CFTR/MRP), member 1
LVGDHTGTKVWKILVAAIAIITTVQCFIEFASYPDVSLGDVRFWTTVLQIGSLGVIFTIHELEHERLRVPSGAVLFYWLFYIVVSTITTRSLYIRQSHQALFALTAINVILSVIVFILETFVPKRQSVYRLVGDEKELPSEYSHVFSKISFSWFTPLMRLGWKRYLTEDDMYDLPNRNTSRSNGDRFEEKWAAQARKPKPSFWMALLQSFGGSYLTFVPLKIAADCLSYSQPQLLRLLINFVETYSTDNPDPAIRGFAIAITMFCVSVTQSVLNNNFMNSIFELGANVKSGLISVIYKKSLRLSNEGRAAKSTGDIVNLMVVDTQRISELSRQGFQLWSAPFQITLCLISLNQLLGWTGFAGLGVMCVMIPVNMLIARLTKALQKRQMKNKDRRTRVTTEILMNIKSIKLYSWTSAFVQRLSEVRSRELKTLRKLGGVQAMSRFCWNSTPFFVSCATFTLYVLVSSKPLSVDLVFPALTLFNLLTQPLTMLPNVISSVVESMVAVNRLRDFFLAGELQDDAVQHLPAAKKRGEEAVAVREGCFTWGSDGDKEVLSDIEFTAAKGQLHCIVGRVGSGKSSLLHGILGDLHKLSGHVMVKGSIAFVAQNAWIMNASVKENILFGSRFDPEFYSRTIKACALTEDIAILPDGDQTQVGEKGISLSGGQKARLQLARAVYARADVYLLDDILSAVDQHVGRHIINEVVGARGLLRDKTRVLATNSIPVLKEANHITLVSEGHITEQGTYWDVMTKDGEIASLIKAIKSDTGNDGTNSPSSSNFTSPTKATSGMDSAEETVAESDDEEFLPAISEKQGLLEKEDRRPSSSSFRRVSISSISKSKKADEEMALVPLVSRQTKEVSEKGKVKWNVYLAYAKACNPRATVIWFATIFTVQSLNVAGSVWLKNWAEGNEQKGSNESIAKNVGIYFALGMSASAMLVVQTLIMWVFCSIQASKKLHNQMAHAMFRSPMSFFETTPVGRILNRFSADMFRVDEAIGRSFSEFFSSFARASFTLGVICVTTPMFIALLVPLAILYIYIQRYYIKSNRELKRLESTSRSPIYAHFGETLSGISTIRAFRHESIWSDENEHRVDTNMKAFFPAIYANRWLGIRLEFIGALVVLLAASLSILSVINYGAKGPSAGMIGLAMSYALQITQTLNWMVRLSVEVETNIVSVERVLEYTELPSEAEEVISSNRPAPTWPSKGVVNFNDYSMRYRPGLKLVLKNICLNLKAREKIGVVGRTGAGKSSLTLALFRIVEAASGGIDIDDIDTSSIGLGDLRSKLAIIPQDAALFEGTVRDNLDPDHRKSDDELWGALGTFEYGT